MDQFGGGFSSASAVDNIQPPAAATPVVVPVAGQGTQPGETVDDVQSVHNGHISPGAANVAGGVARRKRRGVKPVSRPRYGEPIPKNYRTSEAVMFNNISEMFLDSVSPEYAQEIIEELFEAWGVPTEQPEAAKYSEDLVFSFIAAVTASNKADYNREFEIPTLEGEITVSFSVLSELLISGHSLTRRRFARGVADRVRQFLLREENSHLLPLLAGRVGCDPQYASLAFDGSTHCTGMTSREVQFTKTLESRNLFEDDAVLAAGASERLLQGPSGGPRSVVPR